MRLFIGLPLDSAASADTARLAQRCAALIPGRYTLQENYHITLAFLGEVSPNQLEDAKSVLSALTQHFQAPELVLEQIAHFRQPSNAILIRSVSNPDHLSAMHHCLRDLLNTHALPHTEGPFSPHVTLARHANLTQADCTGLFHPPVSFLAHNAVLYLSARDDQDVLRYTPLFSAPFISSP